jgi:tetratricopeptide (TPR) repeat protein
MLATSNSRVTRLGKPARFCRKFKLFALLQCCGVAGWLGALADFNAPAQIPVLNVQPLDGTPQFSAQYKKAYQTAKARFEADTNNAEAAWQFGQACFDWADCVGSDAEREQVALQGIQACRALIERDTNSAPGYYYLGMDLGELASTKSLGALKIVQEMEAEFKIAASLDPKFDYGGPDRNLGLLYHQAPGWPMSIGNKANARQHLQKALKLFPDYPENVLNLVEADLDWGDKSAALRQLKVLDELWSAARIKFSGDKWDPSWADWETRRDRAKKKAGQAPHALEPPHKISDN